MRQPPDEQKEDEEQTIHPIEATNMTVFPIPATTFEILKGGLHSPAPSILRDPLAAGKQIRNDEQRLFFLWCPIGTQIGLNRRLLPQPNRPIKPLARRTHQLRNRTGRLEATLWGPMLTGMLGADPKE